jgi:hypothetical protein
MSRRIVVCIKDGDEVIHEESTSVVFSEEAVNDVVRNFGADASDSVVEGVVREIANHLRHSKSFRKAICEGL